MYIFSAIRSSHYILENSPLVLKNHRVLTINIPTPTTSSSTWLISRLQSVPYTSPLHTIYSSHNYHHWAALDKKDYQQNQGYTLYSFIFMWTDRRLAVGLLFGHFQSRIQDSDSRIPQPGFRMQNPESRIQYPGSCIRDPGSCQDPEACIQDPGSRTQDPSVSVT